MGAVATLYDLSSVPSQLFNMITNMAENVDVNGLDRFGIDVIGHHYFDSTGTPTFDLGATGFLSGKKQGDIPAPSGAYAGASGAGAVDWLELGDKGGSHGVLEVYRVETAGGKAPANCGGQGATLTSQYAAQYWFFG